MARLLLVHPLFLSKNPKEQAASSPYFPLGLLYLAGYVRDAGHDVAIFDATFCDDESDFAMALSTHNPDIVGVSALQPTRSAALDLAAMAASHRSAGRRPLVVLGGPDPTADPHAYMEHPAVDLVVHHEGEQTITRLADLIDAGDRGPANNGAGSDVITAEMRAELGIAYQSPDGVVVNPPRPPIEDLDTLPLPARDLIDMERYLHTWEENNGYRSVTIASTRGCPYGCKWCQDAVHGTGFRQRSPESVAAEVAALGSVYGIDRLRMVDDVDGMDRTWFDQWASASAATGTTIPFEPLNDIAARDLPLLDVQDSL